MNKTLGKIVHMKAALWVNAFCFYFQKLWLVGKWMPDSVYSNYKAKKALTAAAVVIRQLIDFFGKPLYLFCFAALPALLTEGPRPVPGEQSFAAAVQMLFFLNCVIGAFGDSQIFTVTRDKVTCIKYLHMDARAYVRAFLAFKYVPFFLYYLIWLPFFARLMGGTPLQGILLWLVLLSFRMIGEAFQLLVYDRTGKVISRGMAYDWVIIGVGLAGAYLPAILGWSWTLAAILLHPAFIAVCAVAGGYCFWYITAGYRGYEKKFHRSIDLNFLLSTLLKSSGSASFKEVEIRETDADVSAEDTGKLQHYKGFSYLNALFFARHRRQLVKPLYYRFAWVAVFFGAAVALFVKDRTLAVKLSENLTASLLPTSVFIMYSMTVADKACRSMFYNCDKDLLHYSFYRKPDVVLRNFQIRLLRVALYNAAVAAAVCLAAAVFCLICGTGIFTWDILLFCVTIFLLSVLFTAHHLCLYYIFQPYSENLQIKNPFFSVVNVIMYTLCFLCLRFETGGLGFTMAVLAFTVVYIAAALALVRCLAPKTFRAK